MARAGLVVIGGSAGALRPVRQIVAALPPDFSSPVLVVIHYPEDAPSSLARILERSGPLAAVTLAGVQPLVPGRIGVCPPGRHLVVRGRSTSCEASPRENGQRPSIDVLFRTAARALGGAVTCVLLSGTLHDGSLGVGDVVGAGGRAFVQDPVEADYESMPLSAIGAVDGVEIAPVAEIVRRLVAGIADAPARGGRPPLRSSEALALRLASATHAERLGQLARLEAGAHRRDDPSMAETYRLLAVETARNLRHLRRSIREGDDLAHGAFVGDDAVEEVRDIGA